MVSVTQKSPQNIGNIAVFSPHTYKLEGRFYDFHSIYTFPENYRFSMGDLNIVIPDTEIEYPTLQRSVMPVVVGMRETLTLRETGQEESYDDIHFLRRGRSIQGPHWWRWRHSPLKKPDVSEIDPNVFHCDPDIWKLYALEAVLKEAVRSTQFSEDLEDDPFIRWLRNPSLTYRDQPNYLTISVKSRTPYPIFSALFTNTCEFVFPEKGVDSTERFLEIRLSRSITEGKTEPFLISPLEIKLIEVIGGEARFEDLYQANEDRIVYHEWEASRIHRDGRIEHFPMCCGSEKEKEVDPRKLFHYGAPIGKMLNVGRLDPILETHPIFQRLSKNSLWNLPVYSKLNQEETNEPTEDSNLSAAA